MIFLVVEDGVGAVELFEEKEANHLVVEGHLREGEPLWGSSVDCGGETVSTADDEVEGTHAGVELLL